MIKRLPVVIAFFLLAIGVALLVNTQSPRLFPRKPLDIKTTTISLGDQLVIPTIGVQQPIAAGDESVLERGVWHRYPERGNPIAGGNFILSAHRFWMGLTPADTIRKSAFYDIDKLNVGDKLYVDWQQKRYGYIIKRKYSVEPNAVEIEAPSNKAKLTLYTCTLGGSADGRVVIEAQPEFSN